MFSRYLYRSKKKKGIQKLISFKKKKSIHRFFRTESAGVDRPSDGAQEAETLLQIPDIGTGERVPVQRLRFEAETLGAGAQSQPDGASSQDLVPEPADEEQEKQPEATGRWQ